MTRLRYKKLIGSANNPDLGIYNLKTPILCNTIIADARVDHGNLTYSIHDIDTGETLLQGKASTLWGLKKKVKNSFIELGANFGEEARGKNRLVLE